MAIKLQVREKTDFIAVKGENGEVHLFYWIDNPDAPAAIILTRDGPQRGGDYENMMDCFEDMFSTSENMVT